MSTDLSKYDNSAYDPGGGAFKRLLWYYVNILFFKSPLIPSSALKCTLLRLFGAKVGKGVNIKPAVNIKYPWRLTVGDYAWIGEYAWIDNLDEVVIGKHCCISQGAMLLCGNHNYRKPAFDLITGRIILEDGAWIGAYSIVCPGVTCKSHAVLAVNSVATRNLEAFSIYQGNPAVKVKDRVFEPEMNPGEKQK
ncbi:MAG: putative colanic acid biosynthesis acetyltransferase [Bacteroidales bacterium]|nr:putative colanic acid biosynthesis acetyltransferase [Bacteroidales bacterium]HNW73948.1 putative colanic acid biosynthesis acetyltransferase [Bacteroidales bacterium]HPS50222.1 putative colanic acid biosynthesis acetyltransferase [Bacteroidales bacterium]